MNKPKANIIVDIGHHIEYDLPEHEVLLKFNGDDDAADFETWWNTVGYDKFNGWLRKERSRD